MAALAVFIETLGCSCTKMGKELLPQLFSACCIQSLEATHKFQGAKNCTSANRLLLAISSYTPVTIASIRLSILRLLFMGSSLPKKVAAVDLESIMECMSFSEA